MRNGGYIEIAQYWSTVALPVIVGDRSDEKLGSSGIDIGG